MSTTPLTENIYDDDYDIISETRTNPKTLKEQTFQFIIIQDEKFPISLKNVKTGLADRLHLYIGSKTPKYDSATVDSKIKALDLLTKGFVDDNYTKHRAIRNSATAIKDEIGSSRLAVLPYLNILRKLQEMGKTSKPSEKDQAKTEEEKREYVSLPRQKFYSANAELINEFEDKLTTTGEGKEAGDKKARATKRNAKAHLYRIMTLLKMTPEQFLQLESSELTGEQKLNNIKRWLKEKRPQFEAESKARQEKLGKVYVGSSWKTIMGTIRQLMERMGNITVPDQDSDSVLMQDITKAGHGGLSLVGKYADIKAEKHHLEDLEKCLDPKRDGSEETKNAYFLLLLNLELGLRQFEALTISTAPPDPKRPTNSSIEQMDLEGVKGYDITYKTRKTAWTNKHVGSGLVQRAELVDLIDARLKEIEDKSNKNDVFKIFNARTKEDENNIQHTLIGHDNEYVKLDSIQKPQPKQITKNITNLGNILKKCYRIAKLSEDYWIEKPFHSMRHIFAHYWLLKTGFDYGFVADKGHWGATTELVRSYGTMPKKIFYAKISAYNDKDYPTIDEYITTMKNKIGETAYNERNEKLNKVYGSELDAKEKKLVKGVKVE